MSRTTVKALWPGDRAESLVEYGNSWGSAPPVWGALSLRYLGTEDWFLSEAARSNLWKLWKRRDVPKAYRAVLMWTFDRAYVLKKNYARMAADIDAYLAKFPIKPECANHWPTLAALLRTDPEIPAIGLHCTSVSENPFLGSFNEETEDYAPFDWSTAYDLYAAIDENDNEMARGGRR